MSQTVTTATIIRDKADKISSIKVFVTGENINKQYEIKIGGQFMLESPHERFEGLRYRMVRVEGFEEIPAGYCIRVFHIEAQKELTVGLEELKSIFKWSSQ
ncbi:hypothetical protein [Marinilactibacillus sp. Marseille-P9653]|uniref:hypothetical protein n=1 Tax=Marinilactibacillus sp. Marseille-P9653 TaxID=2866583 RepID=UPI001CE3FF86|nr:hypothetical protein [Marinilactibacillus sp. Marseille-P9653]